MTEQRALILTDCNLEELAKVLREFSSSFSMPAYKIKEIYRWLCKGADFEEMTSLSKEIRQNLAENFTAQGAKIIEEHKSKDGSIKYLFSLFDGNIVEGVLMPYKYGNTLCVSTQVGCRMGCAFCASTIGGLVRNLSVGEMFSFVALVNKNAEKPNDKGGTDRGVTNVVLMGSGEPLDNYVNVVAFLKRLGEKEGLNISLRNFSLSTCGLVPKMYALAEEGLPINLTVSLHASSQSQREELMPVAKKYSLAQVIAAAKNYFDKTGRRVIFEYTLVKGVNDREEDAVNLSKLLKGFPNHVNLIRLSPVKEKNLQGTSLPDAYAFQKKLTELNLSATVRRQMGLDIAGACGQLRNLFVGRSDPKN